jgi:hypothetical protein
MRRISLLVVLSFAVLALGSSFAGANGNGLPAHKDKDVCTKAKGPDLALAIRRS